MHLEKGEQIHNVSLDNSDSCEYLKKALTF